MLASVLSGLLSAVVTHSKNSCIRLSAKIYGNVVLVQVKDSTASNTAPLKRSRCVETKVFFVRDTNACGGNVIILFIQYAAFIYTASIRCRCTRNAFTMPLSGL